MAQNNTKARAFHYGWVIVVTGALVIFSCFGLARYAYTMLLPGMQAGLGFAYEKMGLSIGSFPVTEKAAKEILSLPMYPALTENQQNRVVDGISDFLLETAKAPGTSETSLSDAYQR